MITVVSVRRYQSTCSEHAYIPAGAPSGSCKLNTQVLLRESEMHIHYQQTSFNIVSASSILHHDKDPIMRDIHLLEWIGSTVYYYAYAKCGLFLI